MIRLLMPDDYALWKAIRLEAVERYPDCFGSTYEEESSKSDDEWRPNPDKLPIFAYFDNHTPVGIAGYIKYTQVKRRHIGHVVTIYVRKEYRGQGIMDALLDALAQHAHGCGVEQLQLSVGMFNVTAKRCYERNGFKVYGTQQRALKIGDRYIDDYLMVKYL